jgi:uncharacterized protein YegJ (DUF2314 family)
MRNTVIPLLALLVASGCKHHPSQDKVVMVNADDSEMSAAMAAARSKVAEFWRRLDKPADGETGFSVKVPVTDPNGTEYFWLTNLSLAGGKVAGTIDNDPNIVKTVRTGQRIEMAQDSVVDWLYMRDGKMYGNYTVRPLLKTMDPAEAQQLKAIMAEP